MTGGTIHGILAQFTDPGALLTAAARVRDAGYEKFDCHSPFPIHGMDRAMGMKRSKLGYVVAVFAILGGTIGLALQGWTAAVDYPIVVSGKPLFSWQAFMIVTFALFVLFGAFAALFGMLYLSRLPRFHHPLFYSDSFRQASDDGFFISIEREDPNFEATATTRFLETIGGLNVEVLQGDE